MDVAGDITASSPPACSTTDVVGTLVLGMEVGEVAPATSPAPTASVAIAADESVKDTVAPAMERISAAGEEAPLPKVACEEVIAIASAPEFEIAKPTVVDDLEQAKLLEKQAAEELAAASQLEAPTPATTSSSSAVVREESKMQSAPMEAKATSDEPEFEEAKDFSAEPLETRLQSKDLNRRCSAYAEMQATMETSATPEVFEVFWKHLDVCIGETLPKGQDAALIALSAYLERCPNLQAADVLPLVRKLVMHKSIDKPKMQQLVPPVILSVAEVCEGPTVVKEVLDCLAEIEGAKKKVQGFFKKQVAFIIRLFYQLLADFGPVKISLKLGYIGVAIKYSTDSDRGIREACYSTFVELSCWLGDISEAVKSMEEPQRKELAKRVADLSDEDKKRGQAKRFYRGEKVEAAKDETNVEKAAPIDSFDFAEAVDAQKKLPKGWSIAKVFSMEKWKEKHIHLQVLSAALDASKLLPGEFYASLVPSFVRLLKSESNIPVVAEAAKCVGLMACGLRKDFEKSARQLLPVTLNRINDKSVWKPDVFIKRVEQLMWSIAFEFLLEELRPFIASKSNFVKKEAMGLLLRSVKLPQVQQRDGDVVEKFFSQMVVTVLPNIDDADNTVRLEAAKLLALVAHHNPDSPDLFPLLISKVPPARRNFFEDEWRKMGKELDSSREFPGFSQGLGAASMEADSHESQCSTTSEPKPRSSASRVGVASSSTTAHGSSEQGRPGSRQASPARREQRLTPGSPSKRTTTSSRVRGLALTPRSQQSVEKPIAAAAPTETPTVAPLAQPIAQLEEDTSLPCTVAAPMPTATTVADSSTIEALVGQIRHLNAKVEYLEAQQTAQFEQELQTCPRTPSRGGRPMTPQKQRAPSAERLQASTKRIGLEPQSERRLSNSSMCTSPAPAKRSVRTPATQRAGTPEAGMRRQRSSAAEGSSMRRNASADTLMQAVPFKIDPPKQSKVVRQLRERGVYWGPDPIPQEHLSGLKESFKLVIDVELCRKMFSDKMEEQLQALQCWKRHIPSHFSKGCEVLDMVLKWLTWMLFTSNTQTWKLALEVVTALLAGLIETDAQLTEREAQILVPNIVERSGHNNPTIRDSMMAVLGQCFQVHPRLALLPMCLRGITSKNKRSVNCSLRAIIDNFDRQVAYQLLRAQKDVMMIVKMMEDKDAELRKAALHTVALLSLYAEADAYARGCERHLSKDAQTAVRTFAAKLPAPAGRGLGEDSSVLDASHDSGEVVRERPATPPRRLANNEASSTRPSTPRRSAGVGEAARAATPRRMTAEAATTRIATPPRRTPATTNNTESRISTPRRSAATAPATQIVASPHESRLRPRVHSPLRRDSTIVEPETATLTQNDATTPANFSQLAPSPSPISTRSTPLEARSFVVEPVSQAQDNVQKVLNRIRSSASDADFKEACEEASALVKEASSLDKTTFALLGEVLVFVLHEIVTKTGTSEEYASGALLMMEAFSDKTEECRQLPAEFAFDFFRASLKLLQFARLGKSKLEKLNACFVKVLAHTPTRAAIWALLEILPGDDGRDLKSLVGKCIKKVTKIAISERSLSQKCEMEARNATEVVINFLKKHQAKLAVAPEKHKGCVEILREVLETARKWSPEVVDNTFAEALAAASPDEKRLLQDVNGDVAQAESLGAYLPSSKENVPVCGTVVTSTQNDKKSVATLEPPKQISPCVARNA